MALLCVCIVAGRAIGQDTTGDEAVYSDGAVEIPVSDEFQFGLMMHTQGGGI